MEDDLNFQEKGGRPQFSGKWKKVTSVFRKMEVDHNFQENGRRHKFSGKWKMTSIFRKMEDDLKNVGKRKTT